MLPPAHILESFDMLIDAAEAPEEVWRSRPGELIGRCIGRCDADGIGVDAFSDIS